MFMGSIPKKKPAVSPTLLITGHQSMPVTLPLSKSHWSTLGIMAAQTKLNWPSAFTLANPAATPAALASNHWIANQCPAFSRSVVIVSGCGIKGTRAEKNAHGANSLRLITPASVAKRPS
jgi:hypothetical protein